MSDFDLVLNLTLLVLCGIMFVVFAIELRRIRERIEHEIAEIRQELIETRLADVA
jgi:hypothetical protein